MMIVFFFMPKSDLFQMSSFATTPTPKSPASLKYKKAPRPVIPDQDAARDKYLYKQIMRVEDLDTNIHARMREAQPDQTDKGKNTEALHPFPVFPIVRADEDKEQGE
jgi:hypothetical protein